MDYRCLGCDTEGVKLWRVYSTFLGNQSLKCRTCSEKEQKRTLNAGDQIGWRVPAVPDATGTFWGYTAVPDGPSAWWKALPDVDSRKAGREA